MENMLQEFNALSYQLEELNEDGQPKKFRLKGVFQAADVPNGNKRVYPRAVLESAITGIKPMVTERRMLGELDHPADAKIHLDKVSHIVTKLEMTQDGKVYGEAEVLPTAPGRILESLLKSQVKLGISSRGFGSTKANDAGLDEVQNDYKIVTFDIVSDPSTPGAFPSAVYEDKKTEEKKEEEKEEEKEPEYIVTLESVVEEILDTGAEVIKENKEFVCTDGEGNRFYIVEGEKDSYGHLNFHVSHDFHLLMKSEDRREELGINDTNLSLIEDVYGDTIASKIRKSLANLGYDAQTLNRKKEDK
jgi:hypothetical protein